MVSLLALGLGFMGFVLFLVGLGVFVSGAPAAAVGGSGYGAVVSILGLLLLPAAVGLWRLEAWGWWLAVVGHLGIAVAILALGPNKVGAALPLAILGLVVLLRDDFRVGRSRVTGRRRNRVGRTKGRKDTRRGRKRGEVVD